MFVKEYLIDLNATQAAIRAGYSVDTAQQMGSENLLKPVISKAIQLELDKRAEKTELTAEWVLDKIISDVKRNSGDENYNSMHLLKGAELLGKHLKLFTDITKHEGEFTVNLHNADVDTL